jgi:hypothetical protein
MEKVEMGTATNKLCGNQRDNRRLDTLATMHSAQNGEKTVGDGG